MKKKYFLKLFALLIMVSCNSPENQTQTQTQTISEQPKSAPFSLNDLHRRTFNFFWELADSVSAQSPDRWPSESFSSIASTGFGLTSYIIGVENSYITREEAANRVLRCLTFLYELPQGDTRAGIGGYKGFFYHFLDMRTGERFKNVELSTIDTGLLMAGVLTCLTYFDGENNTEKAIRRFADLLYRRVEWDWFMNKNDLLSMGWHPGEGFLDTEWSGYNEAMILNILALGSPTHPVKNEIWKNWTKKYEWGNFKGFEHVNFGPLFGHQYSHLFIDFKGIQDEYMQSKGIDYFENSRRATYANQAYCIENPMKFAGYSQIIWGLTACDGPGDQTRRIGDKKIRFFGYSARGAANGYISDDGTIAPTAAGGSTPFAPEICLPALKAMYDEYGQNLYSEYGFKDAFNPTFANENNNSQGWFDVDYLGIDQGPILIMIENYKSNLVWNIMKRNPYIVSGLKKAGFKGGWIDNNGK
jgi:hypothetical protein